MFIIHFISKINLDYPEQYKEAMSPNGFYSLLKILIPDCTCVHSIFIRL